MTDIYALIDYQDRFGSKYDAIPFRSGMDKELLCKVFQSNNFNLKYLYFFEVYNYEPTFWKGKFIIYTSSEDNGLHYKSYIEDIVYYLELANAKVIPSYRNLKANNNKVFMELLRKSIFGMDYKLPTAIYGCIEEFESKKQSIHYPLIFKIYHGAMSRGVDIAFDSFRLKKIIKKYSRTINFWLIIKEILRTFKYENYKPESLYRKKYILQEYIPNLNGDFKVLVFNKKLYVLKRETKINDFRASGSGIRRFTKDIPNGLLEYAYNVFLKLEVPNTSLDIGFDGENFYLIEFQSLYFGSYTISKSEFYWEYEGQSFKLVENKSCLEEEYALSVINFIKNA